MAAVVASALSPSVAVGAPETQWDSSSRAARERLVGEFSAVLSLREAPDAMCLSVNLNGESIFQSRSTTSLVPASLIKVATATAALEVMPPDHVYSTNVFARADAFEAATDGVLRGDVYLVGQGDPVLSTPRYVSRFEEPVAHTDITDLADRVFATLRSHGMTRIEGRLVGDDSWFPDRQRDYSREVPDGGAQPVWRRSLVTSNNVGPLSALLLNDGYSSYTPVRTTAARIRRVRAADPAQHAASVFDDLLEARGMVITHRPASGLAPAPGERTLLGAVESPPLSDILARMLTYSDNTPAEMILKEVGRQVTNSDRASAATAVEMLIRGKLGPLANGVVIADGSGLSGYNRLTCAAMAALLDLAGPGSPVVQGLAVPGRPGALMNCRPVRSSPGHDLNTVRAKTGTLNDVTAMAGTTVTAHGETLTFAMIANSPGIIGLGSCNRLRRTPLNAAANYTYGPIPSDGPDQRDRAFDDAVGHSLAEHLEALAERGVFDGTECAYGRICPDDPIERRTVAVWIVRVLDGRDPPAAGGTAFQDVDSAAWWTPFVERLAELGVTKGCQVDPWRFCPHDSVTREQMASFLVRAFHLDDAPSAGFTDVGGNSHQPDIDALAAAEITIGCSTDPPRFCPTQPVTRAEMATFLSRALGLTEGS